MLDAHVRKIEKTTAEMAHSLPYYAPKPLNMKKAIDKEIDVSSEFNIGCICVSWWITFMVSAGFNGDFKMHFKHTW